MGGPKTTVCADEGMWRNGDGGGSQQWAQSSSSCLIHTHSLNDQRLPTLLSLEAPSLTSKLMVFPHKQALPVCHSLMGPGSHLDSSLPFTASVQAKQPLNPADSTSPGSLKSTYFPHGHHLVHTTSLRTILHRSQPGVVFLEYLSHTLQRLPVHLRKKSVLHMVSEALLVHPSSPHCTNPAKPVFSLSRTLPRTPPLQSSTQVSLPWGTSQPPSLVRSTLKCCYFDPSCPSPAPITAHKDIVRCDYSINVCRPHSSSQHTAQDSSYSALRNLATEGAHRAASGSLRLDWSPCGCGVLTGAQGRS